VNTVLGPDLGQPLVLHRPVLTAGSGWRAMPCVWWPWLCQVVFVESASELIGLDLVALEPARDWTRDGAPVTIIAGRHGRAAWACLSRGHRRVLLTDVTTTALTTG
jgi:hypothetical protein